MSKIASVEMKSKPLNRSLSDAKRAKQDEFYTQYIDIQKEVEAYLEYDADTFRGKIVYCNCDAPFESNFFKNFGSNFNQLGPITLKCTSFDVATIASAADIEGVKLILKKNKVKCIASCICP